jgi:hypothetical protein
VYQTERRTTVPLGSWWRHHHMCLFIPWWRVPKGWVYGRRLVFVSERTNKRHHHLNSDQNSAVCSQLELLLTTYNTPNDPISWTRCLDLLRSEPAYNAAGPTVSLHMFATKHVASKKLTGVRQGGHFKAAYSAEALCWVCGSANHDPRQCGKRKWTHSSRRQSLSSV